MNSKKLTRIMSAIILVAVLGLAVSGLACAQAPKYVFYFIGDGMGASQRQSAEYYLRTLTGDEDAKLCMNKFPVAGMNTTHSLDSLVTDSAAAGTALATGCKTNNRIIAQLPDGTKLRTLMMAAEDAGMATGIVTTTRLTHATPATFASNNESRYNACEIADDYLESGVDFFAGGGYRYFVPQDWKWGKSKRKDDKNVVQLFYEKGYDVFVTEDDSDKFKNYQPEGKDKVFAAFTYSHMPYELDRKEVPSIATMTEKCIDTLSAYDNGFMMMVEGGRIDHACHANDPAGSIHDTIAFDNAVKKAYDFYQEHPDETLIVVAADHETGGFALGFGKNYFLKMDQLEDVERTTADVLNWGEDKYDGDRATFFNNLAKYYGLDDLTSDEKAAITKAMDIVDSGKEAKGYGGYDPVAIEVTHIISERANLYWTTYAHSGTAVPMSAIGVGSQRLGGFKDDTELAQEIAKIMNFKIGVVNDKVAAAN